MYSTKLLFLLNIYLSVTVKTKTIGKAITNYFNSEPAINFQSEWKKYKSSYDNTLKLVLNDVFSRPAINQYVRREPDFFKLADAYYFADNVVDLFIEHPTLRELPRAIMSSASFALASNVLIVDTDLGKMFVDASYSLLRNESALVYEEPGVLKSPFTYQQVQRVGDLTITAEECRLVGTIVLAMNEIKVSVGHSTVSLENCKFNVEIFNPGFKSPPVIAPYFSAKTSKELMRLLSKPIREELVAKMQGAVMNYPSTMHFTDLSERLSQRALISYTRDFVSKVVKSLNKLTVEKNGGLLRLPNWNFNFVKGISKDNATSLLKLRQLKLRGLESAYATHTGGPYKFKDLRISEAITFNRLKVYGKAVKGKKFHKFSMDLVDVSADVTFNVAVDGVSLHSVTVTGWRLMEFSEKMYNDYFAQYPVAIGMYKEDSVATVIIAFLSSELPKGIGRYLEFALPMALNVTDAEIGSQEKVLVSVENEAIYDGALDRYLEGDNNHAIDYDRIQVDEDNGTEDNDNLDNGDKDNGNVDNGDEDNGNKDNGDEDNGSNEIVASENKIDTSEDEHIDNTIDLDNGIVDQQEEDIDQQEGNIDTTQQP